MPSRSSTVACIVPAGGRGRRLGQTLHKPLVAVRGIPILIRTLKALKRAYAFSSIIIPAAKPIQKSLNRLLVKYHLGDCRVIEGGRTRAESVFKGLEWVGNEALTLVHDAARPFVSIQEIRDAIETARRYGAAVAAWPATSTVKQTAAGTSRIRRTLDRSTIYLAQTPQVARTALLRKAYRRLGKRAFQFTDESSILEALSIPVRVSMGSFRNIKITNPEDLSAAELFALKRG